MDALLQQLLPTAPDVGLFAVPGIPAKKLHAAIGDYAPDVAPADVIALYDATRLGSAKDGALFLADRFVFQNNDLQAPRTIRYEDIVGVESKRKLLGGREVVVTVNRGRATVTETIDFSGQAGAAEFVERFLHEAMVRSASAAPETGATDAGAVRQALDALVDQGALTAADRDHMLAVLG